MASAPCAIWKTPADLAEKSGHFEVYDSPRAGGKYWISGTAIAMLGSRTDLAKLLLTTWLCEQRRAGVDTPKIHSTTIETIVARRKLSVIARYNAALDAIARAIPVLGNELGLDEIGGKPTERLLAETESSTYDELVELIDLLQESGLVKADLYQGGGSVRLLVGGWQEIERRSLQRSDSSQAFVAMWFNDATTDAYAQGIEPALAATGYRSMRIDKKDHNNKIDDEIIAEIRRSRFLVADFSCEPKIVRGGVYYEAGFAMGIGIPVIWTCKDTSLEDLHFDTRQYAHIVWKTPADLFEQLKNRIGATIGDGPLPK